MFVELAVVLLCPTSVKQPPKKKAKTTHTPETTLIGTGTGLKY